LVGPLTISAALSADVWQTPAEYPGVPWGLGPEAELRLNGLFGAWFQPFVAIGVGLRVWWLPLVANGGGPGERFVDGLTTPTALLALGFAGPLFEGILMEIGARLRVILPEDPFTGMSVFAAPVFAISPHVGLRWSL
jgi:hypothetical protein